MVNQDSDRIVHTGMYTKKAKEVIDSVFGQMSDGAWENNPYYDRWWKFGDAAQEVDGEVTIHISAKTGERGYNGKWIENGFSGMSDIDIKNWMARMVKKTMQMELKDENISHGWRRDNTDFMTHYLNYDEEINVAEVYCVYEQLLGREIGVTKYSAAIICSVFGMKRQPDEIEAETKKREAAAAVEADYVEQVKLLNDEEKKLISELTAKIEEVKKSYTQKRSDAWRAKLEKLKTIA